MHFSAQRFQAQALVDEVRGLARDLVSTVHLLRELEANGLIVITCRLSDPAVVAGSGLTARG